MSSSSSPPKYYIVGNPSITRRDITRKITGKAVYTMDINASNIGVSGMLYAGVVTCPYPHAKILSIDTSAAEAAGYVTLTAGDLPPYSYYGGGQPHLPLPVDEVMYPGQPVAAVAAPTSDSVVDAIALVKVTYEPLPFVLEAPDALAPGAIQLYPTGNVPLGGFTNENGAVPSSISINFGDAATAMAGADVTVTAVLSTQLEQHYEFEPYGIVANYADGFLRVYTSNEWAAAEQSAVAQYMNIPVNNVTVSCALGGYEGGAVLGMALGDKISGEALPVAAALSRKAGAPVKLILTRADHSTWMNARFPINGTITIGAKSDGTMVALQANCQVNVGAVGGSEGSDAMSDLYSIYTIPNVSITATSANTNKYHQAGAMRDVGESQGHWLIETAVDMLAQKLNMDPAALRQMNLRANTTNAQGQSVPPTDPVTGFPYTGSGQPAAFNNAYAAFNWKGRWKGWNTPSVVNGNIVTGVGIANLNGAKGSVGGPVNGQLQVNPDGSVIAFTGLTDHGAGGNTTFAILAAESLGLTSFENITMAMNDTSLTTNTLGTFGSRGTRVCGLAFIAAAKNLASQWFPLVAAKLAAGTQASNLTFGNNMIYDKTNPSNAMTFTQAAALLPAGGLKGFGVFVTPSGITQRVLGTKFAAVQLNTQTGEVHVAQFTSDIGIGQVVFPLGAESQVRGGLIMGIGETFYQELWVDTNTGMRMNPNFHDFRVPTIMETPDQVDALWEQYQDPVAPFGAVGLGELALMAVSPALGNALTNALGGYRFTKLPITRQDIVAGIQWARQNGVPGFT